MQNPYSADQYPDLSLATTPSLDVASGSSLTHMPGPPLPSIPREQPMLQCSDPGMEINQMGIAPNVPYFDLGLAQSPALPTEVSQYPSANNPTFTAPSLSVPTNKPYDLQAPGIDHIPEMQPDPYTGDLLQFDHPQGLSLFAINHPDPLAIPADPMLPDLADYDEPDNLLMPSVMAVDPSMPDLQSPILAQDVHMPDRPGDLMDSNGNSPDLGPDGDNDDDDGPMPSYNQEYQAPGLSHRQRKQDMLYRGLKGEL